MAGRRAHTDAISAEHPLEPGRKIGGEFVIQPNGSADFIEERFQLYTELKAKYEAEVQAKAAMKTPIKITLPSGDVREGIAYETTPQMVADALKIKGLMVAKLGNLSDASTVKENVLEDLEEENSDNGDDDATSTLWDLNRPLVCSCTLELLKYDSPEGHSTFNHSAAHLTGLSVEVVWGAKVTIGPALQNGFYYDFYLGDQATVNDGDYARVEEAAKAAVSSNARFERIEVSKEDALRLFAKNPFKSAIIATKVPAASSTSIYTCGKFVDLCMGPHIPHLGYIKAFAIEKHSSAYWLGDAGGDSLQRMYGVGFPDVKLLKEHRRRVEEALARDHRVLGQKLGFFFFEPVYSPGCAFWTPIGAKIYNKLIEFMRDEYRFRGFQEVQTPNLFAGDLFKVSGHWQNYKECMFTLGVEGKDWALKPMNCPGHCCIFKHMSLSYRQLPLRLADFGVLHRNELTGSLSGLTRVRRFQQDDGHIFCALDQVQNEVKDCIDFLRHVYGTLGFSFKTVLATRPKKALGEKSLWDDAESQLAKALDASGVSWTTNKGDGAFYGPKIDLKLYDAIGRGHQCGTIQLDFQLPIRFDLQYRTSEVIERAQEGDSFPNKASVASAAVETLGAVEKENAKQLLAATTESKTATELPAGAEKCKVTTDGSLESAVKPGFARPVILHRAILGSVERMSAVLVENFAGKLPFWLSPRQALVCPISEKSLAYGQWLTNALVQQGFDVEIDTSNNTINKKIRDASVMFWNFILVVGEKEEAERTITVRCRENPQQQESLSLQVLVTRFRDLRDIAHRKQLELPEYISTSAPTTATITEAAIDTPAAPAVH